MQGESRVTPSLLSRRDSNEFEEEMALQAWLPLVVNRRVVGLPMAECAFHFHTLHHVCPISVVMHLRGRVRHW